MTFPTQTRNLPQSTTRQVVRVTAGSVTPVEDTVATEFALTVFVNQQEMATVVCTPEHMEELAVGFLASEGVIRSLDQIVSLQVSTYMGTVRVETTTDVNFNQSFYNKRYIGSCCGKSRQSFYFYNDAQIARPISDDGVALNAGEVLQLMTQMEQGAQLFFQTGGVHAAGLFDETGELHLRMDIGRHNALDKLYGYGLTNEVTLKHCVIAFSGRLSSEVVLKVAKMGVPVIIAKSAPTALAIDIAEEMNITTVGFARLDSFNVYTHPERIRMPLANTAES